MRKNWKVLFALLAVFSLVAAACGDDDDSSSDGDGDVAADSSSEDGTPAETDVSVGLTYDIGGRGDLSFNDSAYAGVERAQNELGITFTELTPIPDGSDRPQLLQLQAESNPLVIGVGFLFADNVAEAAANNPEVNFAVIDDPMLVDGEPRCPNCAGLTFAEEQGSFLVGVAAALKTETDHIGFIGGVSGYGLIEKFEAGFEAGAKAINPDIKIDSQYITAFPDFDGFVAPDRAREIANSFYDGGADIVYHAAGDSGPGLFEAAKAFSDSSGSHVWAIGVDSDQYNTVDPALQEFVLTSMIKRVDTAVFEVTKSQVDGAFTPGQVIYDLAGDGVGYSTSGGFIDDFVDQLEDYKAQIISGDLVVPTTPGG